MVEISLTKNLERKKKKNKYREEQIGEVPFSIPRYNLSFVNLYTKFEVSILNGYGDIFDEKIWRERKKNKFREEQLGEGPFAIPRYNLSM